MSNKIARNPRNLNCGRLEAEEKVEINIDEGMVLISAEEYRELIRMSTSLLIIKNDIRTRIDKGLRPLYEIIDDDVVMAATGMNRYYHTKCIEDKAAKEEQKG